VVAFVFSFLLSLNLRQLSGMCSLFETVVWEGPILAVFWLSLYIIRA
jgi:hypothetical protein